MTKHEWETELAFAHQLADVADRISMRFFRSDLTVRTKADGSPVTQADEEIEAALRLEVASTFPEHGVLGEEEGENEGSSGRRWLIDPIDGTKNFSWGIPNWATLVAHEVDGEIVCGVVGAPALGERYAAARGGGATRNGDRIHVSAADDLSSARIGFTSVTEFDAAGFGEAFRALLASTADDRGMGDFYGHMLVAAGSLDAMVEPRLNPWDIGPLGVIVEEAGGRFTTLDGRRDTYGGSGVSTNASLHEAVLAHFARG